jgi:hypothetical protein
MTKLGPESKAVPPRVELSHPLRHSLWAMSSAEAEARYGHFVGENFLRHAECPEDDAFLPFADQAAAEAEMRTTEARLASDKRTPLASSTR